MPKRCAANNCDLLDSPCNRRHRQYLVGGGPYHPTITGIALSKIFLVLLLPLALAGCAVGHITLPMTLGPADASKASCLTMRTGARRGIARGRSKFPSPERRNSPAWSAEAIRIRRQGHTYEQSSERK